MLKRLVKMVRVAVNGFGRIGRNFFRAACNDSKIDFVAFNDLTDPGTLAHLLKYDSVYGQFPGKISVVKDYLVVNGKRIKVLSEANPEKLPWREYRVDIVVESTGRFRDKAGASKHLKAGAKRVIISAPSDDANLTLVMGVNDNEYDPKKHFIISNASCTTNCLAPMAKVLNDAFGIKRGFMSTIHAVTSTQNTVDGPHKDLRRARSALTSIIPTTTGATEAVIKTIPELKGRLTGLAFRVPVLDGSVVDFVAEVRKPVTAERVNKAFNSASLNKMKGIIQYTEDPIVSADIVGNSNSCVFDAKLTQVIGDTLVKVIGWYDNEWGYSNRLVDLVKKL